MAGKFSGIGVVLLLFACGGIADEKTQGADEDGSKEPCSGSTDPCPPEPESSCLEIGKAPSHCADGSCELCGGAEVVLVCDARGACAVEPCEAGTLNCNGFSADFCEVGSQSDTSNCGSCGFECNLPGASELCIDGQCKIGVCLPGTADCDEVVDNGCEVDLMSSTEHCGSCEAGCAHACVDGECEF